MPFGIGRHRYAPNRPIDLGSLLGSYEMASRGGRFPPPNIPNDILTPYKSAEQGSLISRLSLDQRGDYKSSLGNPHAPVYSGLESLGIMADPIEANRYQPRRHLQADDPGPVIQAALRPSYAPMSYGKD